MTLINIKHINILEIARLSSPNAPPPYAFFIIIWIFNSDNTIFLFPVNNWKSKSCFKAFIKLPGIEFWCKYAEY